MLLESSLKVCVLKIGSAGHFRRIQKEKQSPQERVRRRCPQTPIYSEEKACYHSLTPSDVTRQILYINALGIKKVHPVNGEVPPVQGKPWKLPHYANSEKTTSSGEEPASARSCFSTVRTALGKLRITGLLVRFDVARSFPQFLWPLLLQPTILTSERGADLGSGRRRTTFHLPIYRMIHKKRVQVSGYFPDPRCQRTTSLRCLALLCGTQKRSVG